MITNSTVLQTSPAEPVVTERPVPQVECLDPTPHMNIPNHAVVENWLDPRAYVTVNQGYSAAGRVTDQMTVPSAAYLQGVYYTTFRSSWRSVNWYPEPLPLGVDPIAVPKPANKRTIEVFGREGFKCPALLRQFNTCGVRVDHKLLSHMFKHVVELSGTIQSA